MLLIFETTVEVSDKYLEFKLFGFWHLIVVSLVIIAIHRFDNYVIWPGSLALMNCEPITLRNLLMVYSNKYHGDFHKSKRILHL